MQAKQNQQKLKVMQTKFDDDNDDDYALQFTSSSIHER